MKRRRAEPGEGKIQEKKENERRKSERKNHCTINVDISIAGADQGPPEGHVVAGE